MAVKLKDSKEGFFSFFIVHFSTLINLPASDSTVCHRMLGLNPGLLRLWHLAVRRSNHSARSHLIIYVSVRVADPHHFNADPNSAFHFSADPDPDPAF